MSLPGWMEQGITTTRMLWNKSESKRMLRITWMATSTNTMTADNRYGRTIASYYEDDELVAIERRLHGSSSDNKIRVKRINNLRNCMWHVAINDVKFEQKQEESHEGPLEKQYELPIATRVYCLWISDGLLLYRKLFLTVLNPFAVAYAPHNYPPTCAFFLFQLTFAHLFITFHSACPHIVVPQHIASKIHKCLKKKI